MREMVHVVVWFAVVTVIGLGVIGIVDTVLGIHHVNTDGATAGRALFLLHHLPYVLFGGTLVWLHHRMFGR